MTNELFLLRGLPSSGKSTLAQYLVHYGGMSFAADDWFDKFNECKFDASKLSKAHEWCQKSVKHAMSWSATPIVVHNTFSRLWEMQPYLDMAKQMGYKITVLTVEAGLTTGELANRSAHGVPEETIIKMMDRWEKF